MSSAGDAAPSLLDLPYDILEAIAFKTRETCPRAAFNLAHTNKLFQAMEKPIEDLNEDAGYVLPREQLINIKDLPDRVLDNISARTGIISAGALACTSRAMRDNARTKNERPWQWSWVGDAVFLDTENNMYVRVDWGPRWANEGDNWNPEPYPAPRYTLEPLLEFIGASGVGYNRALNAESDRWLELFGWARNFEDLKILLSEVDIFLW